MVKRSGSWFLQLFPTKRRLNIAQSAKKTNLTTFGLAGKAKTYFFFTVEIEIGFRLKPRKGRIIARKPR
jgi:hypothetical protein